MHAGADRPLEMDDDRLRVHPREDTALVVTLSSSDTTTAIVVACGRNGPEVPVAVRVLRRAALLVGRVFWGLGPVQAQIWAPV